MKKNSKPEAPKQVRNAVILTAIPVEYASVRSFLKEIKEVTHPQGTIYEVGRFPCITGTDWNVAIVETGAGNSGAGIEAERAIGHFSPSVILFVGVAGGVKDVELGDVVVASKIYGYESGKSKEQFMPRPSVGSPSYPLLQRAKSLARKKTWYQRCKVNNVERPDVPKVLIGPIAAGEKVVASTRSKTAMLIRKRYSDSVTVEMEGRGFLQAVYANNSVDALVVRGISDLITGKHAADSAGFQTIAANCASAFELLANVPDTSDVISKSILKSDSIDRGISPYFCNAMSQAIELLREKLKDKDETEIEKAAILEKDIENEDFEKWRVEKDENVEEIKKRLINSLHSLRKQIKSKRTVSYADNIKDVARNLELTLEKTAKWANQVKISDAKKIRKLSDVYISLDIYLYPRKIRANENEIPEILNLNEIFSATPHHILLLGQPGAGKTTSMKRLFEEAYSRFGAPNSRLPIVVRLRESNESSFSIRDALLQKLNLGLEFGSKLQGQEHHVEVKLHKTTLMFSILESTNALVILDGFDELTVLRREEYLSEIRALALEMQRSRLVITSRGGEFNYTVDGIEDFEIAPLNESQILEFSKLWLGSNERAEEFYERIENSPFFDTAMRPLSLAYLCAIYDRTSAIPEKPRFMYSKVIKLLIEEWDEQRSIARSSVFDGFSPDRKREFLSALAFNLTCKLQSTVFRTEGFRIVFESIHEIFCLPRDASRKVANELESHTGLFLKAGDDMYEFAHKSIQEFLTACHILNLPDHSGIYQSTSLLPNELAIVVCMSSDQLGYLSLILNTLLDSREVTMDFYNAFVDRLLIEAPNFADTFESTACILRLTSQWVFSSIREDETRLVPKESLKKLFSKLGLSIDKYGERLIKNYAIRKRNSRFKVLERKSQNSSSVLPDKFYLHDYVDGLINPRRV